jgi:hypothetical protein
MYPSALPPLAAPLRAVSALRQRLSRHVFAYVCVSSQFCAPVLRASSAHAGGLGACRYAGGCRTHTQLLRLRRCCLYLLSLCSSTLCLGIMELTLQRRYRVTQFRELLFCLAAHSNRSHGAAHAMRSAAADSAQAPRTFILTAFTCDSASSRVVSNSAALAASTAAT